MVGCCQQSWVISHAWMEETDRHGCDNILILKDASLVRVRIEMLNMGAEYVWLDVLCLRQRGGKKEDPCAKEWKVDVAHYRSGISPCESSVCYLSGLGRPRPFELEGERL